MKFHRPRQSAFSKHLRYKASLSFTHLLGIHTFIPHAAFFACYVRQSADTLVRKIAHLHNLALNKIIAAKSIAHTEFTILWCYHLE